MYCGADGKKDKGNELLKTTALAPAAEPTGGIRGGFFSRHATSGLGLGSGKEGEQLDFKSGLKGDGKKNGSGSDVSEGV